MESGNILVKVEGRVPLRHYPLKECLSLHEVKQNLFLHNAYKESIVGRKLLI